MTFGLTPLAASDPTLNNTSHRVSGRGAQKHLDFPKESCFASVLERPREELDSYMSVTLTLGAAKPYVACGTLAQHLDGMEAAFERLIGQIILFAVRKLAARRSSSCWLGVGCSLFWRIGAEIGRAHV